MAGLELLTSALLLATTAALSSSIASLLPNGRALSLPWQLGAGRLVRLRMLVLGTHRRAWETLTAVIERKRFLQIAIPVSRKWPCAVKTSKFFPEAQQILLDST